MLIWCLRGAISIDRLCGADVLAPGCYFDRPALLCRFFLAPGWYIDRHTLWCWFIGSFDRLALWCWLVGSGVLFQLTGSVVLIWCLRGAILVDNHPPWYDFGRPALWCWFIGSGVLFWYTGPVVLIFWLRGAILIDRPCSADLWAPGCYFNWPALWCWFVGSLWDVVLVDNLAQWYNFYRLASVVLTCWLWGAILIDQPCGADLLALGLLFW